MLPEEELNAKRRPGQCRKRQSGEYLKNKAEMQRTRKKILKGAARILTLASKCKEGCSKAGGTKATKGRAEKRESEYLGDRRTGSATLLQGRRLPLARNPNLKKRALQGRGEIKRQKAEVPSQIQFDNASQSTRGGRLKRKKTNEGGTLVVVDQVFPLRKSQNVEKLKPREVRQKREGGKRKEL